MAGNTNYGSVFTKGGSSPADAIVVDFPELTTGKINATTHQSSGVTEWIPSGLIDASDITLSLKVAAGVLSTIKTEMTNKTVSSCVVSNGLNTFTFSGFYTSLKEEGADATNPDLLKATVVLAITGGVTIS